MKRLLLGLSFICASSSGMAIDNAPQLVIQVPNSYYQRPVHLTQAFLGYWHDRADAAHAVATETFGAHHYSTSSCDANPQGQALVVLEPNMFYNPKQGIFYSEITAKVYTQNSAAGALDKPLLTLKAEGQAVGNLTHNVETFTHRSYQQAFDRLLGQLQDNTVFQQSLVRLPNQTYQALCNSIDTLSQPKIFY